MAISQKTQLNIVAVVLLGMGVAFLAASVRNYSISGKMRAGVVVPAQVVNSWEMPGRGGRNYHLEVMYTTRADGAEIRKGFDVSQSTYEAASRDHLVEVRYLPTSPHVAEVAAEGSPVLGLLASGLFFGGMGVYFAYNVNFGKEAGGPLPAPGT